MDCAWGPAELDALREMGNIGVGSASTALSSMLGRLIKITVPSVYMLKFSELEKVLELEEVVAGTVVGLNTLEGTYSGYLYIVYPKDSPEKLAQILAGDSTDESMIESVVMEVSNILASHFCDGIATMLDTVVMPTPPNYAKDYLVAVIDALLAQIADKTDHLIIFETNLKDEEESIDIFFILIPTKEFFKYIIQLLGSIE